MKINPFESGPTIQQRSQENCELSLEQNHSYFGKPDHDERIVMQRSYFNQGLQGNHWKRHLSWLEIDNRQQYTHEESGFVTKSHTENVDIRFASFPNKLQKALDDASKNNLEYILSWHHDGMSFRVHDSTAFVAMIMPKYFGAQHKYKSFQRQLNLYGFERKSDGKDKGYYHHKFFQRDEKELTINMKVQKIKGRGKKRNKGALSKNGAQRTEDNLARRRNSNGSQSSNSSTGSGNLNEQFCAMHDQDTKPKVVEYLPTTMIDRWTKGTVCCDQCNFRGNTTGRECSRVPKPPSGGYDQPSKIHNEKLSTFAGRHFYSVEDSILRDALLYM